MASHRSTSARPASPDQIASRSGSSFLVSFGLLEPARREALTAVYAFCRVVDDAVDEAADVESGRSNLAYWADELERADQGTPESPVGRALQDSMKRYGVDRRHLQALIDGVALDLEGARFKTFEELERYCFGVASSVGLACLPVFGASGEAAERYAVDLGQALQHTNILRDLRGDAREGRVYVPLELLERHSADPDWLDGGGPVSAYAPGGAVDQVACAVAERARAHFARVDALALDAADRRALLPAEVMGQVYRHLLGRLERLGGRVCRRRKQRVPSWRKLLIAMSARRRAGAAR